MARLIDLTGKRFGRVTVLKKEDRRGYSTMWACRCDCGTQWSVDGSYLRRGDTTSCGCARTVRIIDGNTKHGGAGTAEYRVWCAIKTRCTNPKANNFHLYGGRGIAIASEWAADFAAFAAHIGPRPSPEHSVDRIRNELGYAPGNVRWATRAEQAANRRPRSCWKRGGASA